MIKSFSGQVVFSFALRRAISAYVGENRLSQYIKFVFCCLKDFLSRALVALMFCRAEPFL